MLLSAALKFVLNFRLRSWAKASSDCFVSAFYANSVSNTKGRWRPTPQNGARL